VPFIFQQMLYSQSAFTIGDLFDLAEANTSDDPAARLEKVFDWYFDRAMSVIRFGFLLSGGSFGSLIGAALNHQTDWPIYVLLGAGLLGAVVAVVQMRILAHLHREFVASVRLLAVLRRIRGTA
jgi:hypothetical protein